ncbi:DUF2213 domain-containing protein [Lactobacillus crispatus]|uniref:DUF2213 domain-containing protein n=1 Tax=Lactobacillus crispatus TaxID=47770 RepID=UPI003369E93B
MRQTAQFVDLTITNPDLINKVDNGKRQLSMGFRTQVVPQSGVPRILNITIRYKKTSLSTTLLLLMWQGKAQTFHLIDQLSAIVPK